MCGNSPPIPGNERCPLWLSQHSHPAGPGIPERAQAIGLSPDGSVVYVTGPSHNASTDVQDAVTVAYSSVDGHQLWTHTTPGTPGTYGAYPAALAVSPDGQRVYVTGQWDVSLDFTTSRFGTVAYDTATGEQVWTKTFQDATPGFDYGNALVVAADGATVFVTGNSTAGYRTFAYAAADGSVVWNSTFPGVQEQGGEDIELSPDGTRVYVIGTTPDIIASAYGVVAYDAGTGAQVWAATYHPPECTNNQGYGLAVGPGGDIFVTGFVGNCLGIAHQDYGTAAFSAAGVLRWSTRYAGDPAVQSPQYNSAYRIAADPAGTRVYVSGFSAQAMQQGTALIPVASTGDYATIAYNVADGTQAWAGRYNGGAYDGTQNIAISPNGARLYVTGFSQRGQGFDWATVAYDNAGAQQFVARYHSNASATAIEQGNAVIVSPDNTRLYVAGQTIDDSGAGQDFGTFGYDAGVPLPTPTSAVSRKTHGSELFDINLPLAGNPGIECRKGQGTNSDEHQIVFNFTAPATVASAACDGTPAITSTSGNDVTVNCTAVPNGKVITVALTGVTVGASSGNVSVPMGVLLGDVTANEIVSNTDIAAVKAQVSSPVTASNFRNDVNADGIVSNTDVSATKAQVSTSLP